MYEDTPKPLRNLARSEPLTERSRRMFTVPPEIPEAEFNGLPSACRDFLTKPVAPATEPLYTLSGENYVFKGRVSDLTAKQTNGILNCLNAPNGIKMVSVGIIDDINNSIELEVHFFNTNFLDKIVAKYTADNSSAKAIFPISGGSRLRAGQAAGQVQVDSSNKPTPLAIQMPNDDKPMLRLVVKPIGDYSTYTLAVSPMAIGLPTTEVPAEIPASVIDSLPAACIDFLTKPPAKSSAQALYTLAKQKKIYVLSVRETELSAEQRTVILRCLNVVFDPLFAEINFKFRPGCFNTNCAPEWETAPPPLVEPPIDYLAKDYESFRLTMITAMMERVPGWQATSEADLDVTLLELFSAAADELSDFQDRVMNEAFIASCRKRVSLARHSRLMDYHIHQGNQASTRLALEIEYEALVDEKPPRLKEGLLIWAGESKFDEDKKNPADSAAVFTLGRNESQTVHPLLNRIGLYTWSDSIPVLKAGSTTADLKLYNNLDFDDPTAIEPAADKVSAEIVQELIRSGEIKYLLIQERLNPTTGFAAGRDPKRRQFLKLLTGDKSATAMFDVIENEWFVRVNWEKTDALRRDYCFTVDCSEDSPGTVVGKVENISLFHGNLVEIFHGRPQTTVFRESGEQLTIEPAKPLELFYERTRWGAICPLPEKFLAYQKTDAGGDIPPISTLTIKVGDAGGTDFWDEVPSLIYSDNSDENGDHFIVETDEEHWSLIRFGNGKNGKELPENAKVFCYYQYGEPLTGNVGADSIINFDAGSIISEPEGLTISNCWNPFDVTDAKDFEPVVEIIRRVPEAYRARQLRAVTLADYAARAEDKEIKGVARAAASYAWTGSWRTVRVTIDPTGINEISDELRGKVSAYLDAVRLIGEDIEIRPPKFIPLEIEISLCAEPEIWTEDIRFVLEQEFSDGWTPDGRMGFFHPDLWTFGQSLHASQIIARAMQVKGVEHIIGISIKRWNSPFPASASFTEVNHNEIIEVLSDPDHFERGFISFEIKGGRQ